ncbi:hypothetical protein [Arthrobacter sp. AK04]|uniref:hypothetical protein n=1 Tax=Arthrobacter sp. AK04 TaxID=2900048 RepID=UPI0027E130A1|nr:hypothetical protein [Arthrobacter sp. AK04]
MYTLPAAPPPDASVAAVSPEALQRAGSPGAGAAEDVDVPVADGVADGAGAADVVPGLAGLLAEPVPVFAVVGCASGWLGPQALSISAAAAAAVDMTNPWKIR